ncbi:YeaH/YhbH family protein [Hahella ganghwensis]|uniref:YeaH/YhbH family protein n=1 Tax=Hahella ganghwensis TaxID=286420 RepID=UPI000376122D|nr:YeaH/YhbH family protein [Hahella ganghwensis]
MGVTHVIDRRLNGKNKSAVNRQRFLRRYREHIKKAVADAVNKRSITDIDRGESISIPSKDIGEPNFRHGKGGRRSQTHPGNKEFVTGDSIPRPPGGGGGGGSGQGQASDQGEGMDDFVFQISQEEFLDFMFEDLALPNLVQKQLKETSNFKYVRAGYTTHGTPAKINVIRSMRGAYARRLALSGNKRKKISELEEQLETLKRSPIPPDPVFSKEDQIQALEEEIKRLKGRIQRIPFIDEIDIRYNQHVKQPKPATAAVMFCLMDVSGSMSQTHKDIAKRFFILLYLFLKRNYEKIDVVFIRHHTSAKEVDEEEFFYSRETGGTIVSSALKLMREIMEQRYPTEDWNIYAAQASDGDNWNDDSPRCSKLLAESILPFVQYYSYIEITPHEHQMLWHEYEKLLEAYKERFSMQQIMDEADIYPVFRKLFQKQVEHHA